VEIYELFMAMESLCDVQLRQLTPFTDSHQDGSIENIGIF